VYLADDLKHRRKVAIKVQRPELAAALGAERFLREIETTANLRHPHILLLYDSGDAKGLLFYVMPYVEGESLRDRLTASTPRPSEGIADLHGHGSVQRAAGSRTSKRPRISSVRLSGRLSRSNSSAVIRPVLIAATSSRRSCIVKHRACPYAPGLPC
jgi:serine/threonine protein kinase